MSRILQISPYSFDHPGWVEQYARTLQGLFSEEMITLAGGEDFPIVEPVKHCPLPCFWQKDFWKIFDGIDKNNTKYILSHIRFAPTSWLAFYLAKKRWIQYIHIEHGTGFLIHKNPCIAFVAKLIDLTIGKYIIRHADAVICVSESGKKWIMETFARYENISVIYRGFDFPKIERKHNTIPKIGFVGRLTGLKNIGGLIEALSEIQDEIWNLAIVGDGEERQSLEYKVRNLWLASKIHFLGARSHEWIMREFYPTVDIFVNPSLQEWLPTTVIEALGMGCQVIATDVGGTKEIPRIKLIPPWDIESLKESIEFTLKSPSEIKCTLNFSLEKMRDTYKHLLWEELDNHQPQNISQ